MGRTVALEEVEARTVGDLLRELAREREALHVVFEGGEAMDIGPSAVVRPTGDGAVSPPKLRPLPKLQGTIPPGWEDAVYDFSDSEL